MTRSESRTVRWLVIVALIGATAVMVGVSMRANYLFGYGFGQTPERSEIFGWANVAADLWKVTGLIVVTSLWEAGRKLVAPSLSVIWLICLGWGLIGAIGVYAQDRTAFIGGRAATVATYQDAEGELKEIESKLTTLTKRTPAQVDGAINAVLAQPILVNERVRGTVQKLSEGCTKESRLTAEACLEVAKLRAEHAGALEAQRLAKRQSHLRGEVVRLRESGGTIAADPVAELLAWLSLGQLSVRDISFGFPLVFAFVIEIVSAFGPVGLVAYAQATRRQHAGVSLSQQAAAGSSPLKVVDASGQTNDPILNWLLERAVPGDGAIGAEDLHADYELWCRRNKLTPAKRNVFLMAFDYVRENPDLELADKIKKFGRRYYGIKLRNDGNVTLLPRK